MGEFETQGCCEPPVDFFTASPIEGNAGESFGETVDKWFDGSASKKVRLERLCKTLGLSSDKARSLRYQLLHRSASAIYEAKRYRTDIAAILVHSFGDPKENDAHYRSRDADARFRFVSAKDYDPKPGEIRYDMFKAEFTHVGDMCSFEVLLERIGLSDPALRAISEIVHDIDLKDGKFGREQAPGIAHVIAGICTSHKEDLARIERGSALLDDTYEYFRKRRGR